jgi:hypothetical protein
MPAEKLLELQQSYPSATLLTEGGYELISLPKLKIITADVPAEYEGLLCPRQHSGYETRLFLDRQVNGRGQNWKTFPLLGKTWWACSLQGIKADQPYLNILLSHLRHLR